MKGALESVSEESLVLHTEVSSLQSIPKSSIRKVKVRRAPQARGGDSDYLGSHGNPHVRSHPGQALRLSQIHHAVACGGSHGTRHVFRVPANAEENGLPCGRP